MAIVGLSLGGWAALAYAAEDVRYRAVVALAPLVNPQARALERQPVPVDVKRGVQLFAGSVRAHSASASLNGGTGGWL